MAGESQWNRPCFASKSRKGAASGFARACLFWYSHLWRCDAFSGLQLGLVMGGSLSVYDSMGGELLAWYYFSCGRKRAKEGGVGSALEVFRLLCTDNVYRCSSKDWAGEALEMGQGGRMSLAGMMHM